MKNLLNLAPILLSLALAALPAIPAAGKSEPPLNENFENADFLHDDWWRISGDQSNKLMRVVSDMHAREGKSAVRFEVDPARDNDFRCELVPGSGNPVSPRITAGSEQWYGLSIMPDAALKPALVPEVVWQFHGTHDKELGELSLNPTVALQSDGKQWTLIVRGDANRVTTRGKYDFEKRVTLGPVALGQWTDWAMHVKWSYRSDGFLRLWKNRELVYEGTHPNTFNDEKGGYLKFGIYAFSLRNRNTETRAAAQEAAIGPRVYFHDALRIAGAEGSLDVVSPAPVKK